IDKDPGTCPAAKTATGRTSTTRAPVSASRRTSLTFRGSGGGGSQPTTAGPRRLTSRKRKKYDGQLPIPPRSSFKKASSSGAASRGLVAFSRPMVVVRSSPAGAEQNEPAPWVG